MVTVGVAGGFTTQVDWYEGMNAQNALEKAYIVPFYTPHKTYNFTNPFAIQYYGSNLGYMVIMLMNIYDLPSSGKYWEFFYNGQPSEKGIDSTLLHDGDVIHFQQSCYKSEKHKGTLLEVKHNHAHQIEE